MTIENGYVMTVTAAETSLLKQCYSFSHSSFSVHGGALLLAKGATEAAYNGIK